MEFLDDISVKDFQDLHIKLGWKYLTDELVKASLDGSMFKVSVRLDAKVVGIARIIGDGATHGLLADVIVDPDYQGKGVGKAMIMHLMDKVQAFVDDGRDEFLVELLPTTGKIDFYKKCGFKHKPENMEGVYKWFKNHNLYTDDSKKHYMKLKPEPFAAIKAGTKTIEMRLMDEKRKALKVGDVLIFTNLGNPDERVRAKITALHHFDSFAGIYETFDKVSLGYGPNDDAKPSDMEQYYPKEEIAASGVVGIEIKLI